MEADTVAQKNNVLIIILCVCIADYFYDPDHYPGWEGGILINNTLLEPVLAAKWLGVNEKKEMTMNKYVLFLREKHSKKRK